MSVISCSEFRRSYAEDADDFLVTHLIHSHVLIWMAYERIMHEDLRGSEETDITGLLSNAVEAVLIDPRSPPWREMYQIHEEAPYNDRKRRGKRRLKLDIQIASLLGKRLRFTFEAKILGRGRGVGAYLGKKGLGCFTSGMYPSPLGHAGMLGYIQEGEISRWAERIRGELKKKGAKHLWISSDGWKDVSFSTDYPCSFKTRHSRIKDNNILNIFHTLMLFC
jgi:hypothetical protein